MPIEKKTKPVMMTVDDEPEVLSAVERDLRQHFRADYRVMKVGSGGEALETTRQLKKRGSMIALFLVDQRMPGMTGVELLEKAIELFPDSKRALLTAYADTEAAIKAINEVRLDHYLMKPWQPPEQNLYPALNDLLAAWEACTLPPTGAVRVVGYRSSPVARRST